MRVEGHKKSKQTVTFRTRNLSGLSMNMVIFRDSVRLGVWNESEVRKLCKEGLLLPTDYCRREGMKEWQKLESYLSPPPRKPSLFSRQIV